MFPWETLGNKKALLSVEVYWGSSILLNHLHENFTFLAMSIVVFLCIILLTHCLNEIAAKSLGSDSRAGKRNYRNHKGVNTRMLE